jgi:hypothetical protein
MSDTLTSLIRTYVPIVVGSALSWLATKSIELDEATRTALITGVTGICIALYYTAVRVLEKKWSVFGLLLGSRKQPEYKS